VNKALEKQAEYIQKLQNRIRRLDRYKIAAKKQEIVIERLERLLRLAIQQNSKINENNNPVINENNNQLTEENPNNVNKSRKSTPKVVNNNEIVNNSRKSTPKAPNNEQKP
jgi:hypothetical protein